MWPLRMRPEDAVNEARATSPIYDENDMEEQQLEAQITELKRKKDALQSKRAMAQSNHIIQVNTSTPANYQQYEAMNNAPSTLPNNVNISSYDTPRYTPHNITSQSVYTDYTPHDMHRRNQPTYNGFSPYPTYQSFADQARHYAYQDRCNDCTLFDNSTPMNQPHSPYNQYVPDYAPHGMQNNNPMMQLIANQQQMLQCMANSFLLPKPNIMQFDGNPLNYWQFIRNFDESIHSKASSDNEKLNYLLQFCTENVKQILRNCVLMNPAHGYYEARKILYERFGDPYVIACASVAEVTEGPPIRSHDRKGLQTFADKLKDCELTLSSIGFLDEINSADNLRKVTERFPPYLKGKWLDKVRQIREKGLRPRINDMAEFITNAAKAVNDPVFGQILEQPAKQRNPNVKITRNQFKNNFSVNVQENSHERSTTKQVKPLPPRAETQRPACLFCKDTTHGLSKCDKFIKKSYDERIKFIKEKRLCFNCLKGNHQSKQCYKKPSCEIDNCNKRHHSLVHPPTVDPIVKEDVREDNSGPQVNTNATSAININRVCLPILPVRVCGNNGTATTYALLDKGSDTSLCEKSLVKALGIKGVEHSYTLNTIGKQGIIQKGEIVDLTIKPLNKDSVIELPAVLTVDEIPVSNKCKAKTEDTKKWSHLEGIELPEVPAKVSLLIGNDVPEVFWVQEERRGRVKEPYAVKSILGWTVQGPINIDHTSEINTHLVNGCTADPLVEQLKRFWEVNENPSTTEFGMSVEDKIALKKMESSVVQVDGHYQLSLPWKNNVPHLPSNKYLAESRLKMLKKRLLKDQDLFQKYAKSMNDYVDKGYARQVPDENLHKKEKVWFLPHHPVINPNKPGKVRVVFDCAAKYKGICLNEELLQGPDLTNNLFGVLMRFRQEPIAIMADIEGMFNQVRVNPEDVDALRFLWWPNDDLSKDPVEMQMLVHLFGATSSPSCANFCLHRTAIDYGSCFQPETRRTVMNNFYVDDLLKSVATPDEAIILKGELKAMLSKGGFNLTKWSTNNEEVRSTIPEEEKAPSLKNLHLSDDFPNERALGVLWDVNEDKFKIKVDVQERPLTRRGILSVTSSLYDPLGMVGPFILPAKKLNQDLCRENYSWDEPIPDVQAQRWEQWLSDLSKMSKISINRCIKPENFGVVNRFELHAFADASEIGYGAVAYIRLINSSGDVHVSFMGGRTRLAPLKNVTIPRLELSAAVLAVELANKIKQESEYKIDESYYWTDSTSVLQFIRNRKRRFKVYIANRVAAIHDGSNVKQWSYVKSEDNPADDASRGLSADEMLNTGRWLQGPSFLWKDQQFWPEQPTGIPEVSPDDLEVKKEAQVFQANTNSDDEENPTERLINRFSSWNKLKRCVAWLLRFKKYIMHKYRSKGSKEHLNQSPLTVQDIQEAEKAVIMHVQEKHFKDEISKLKNKKSLNKNSRLIKLDPQLSDGVLTVGGRLRNASNITNEMKHQVILPSSVHVSDIIIRHYHEISAHGGQEHVLSSLRTRFWILRARSDVRHVLHKCIVCRKRSSKPQQQKMGDLPEDRITAGDPPFTNVGVDCFGPFMVKQGRSQAKRYGCIFTCLTTRAVHIEVLHSLDTDSFINALQRFISRRGKPSLMRSDNGTNFKGAQRELHEEISHWNQQKISHFLKQKEISWHFNPPTASNFGGVWERLIRSIRSTLSVLLKQQTVNDETLLTLMTQVEGILNSRPLTKSSDDARDAEALTPNHLLLMKNNNQMPLAVTTKEDAIVRRWKQVQHLADQFWRRWIKEYLPILQERQKWVKPKNNMNVGDLVLVCDDKTTRGEWPLGLIQEVHEGKDGLVRAATIRSRNAVLTRPFNKLCILESAVNQALQDSKQQDNQFSSEH